MTNKVDGKMVRNYFKNLVNRFFKILPMFENKDESLVVYMDSLADELVGAKDVISGVDNSSMYLSLICTIAFFIGNIDSPDLTKDIVKREVFKAIDICNKLEELYGESVVV